MAKFKDGSVVQCKHCGKLFIYEEFETNCCEGNPICDECYEEHYTYCEECGECVPYSNCVFENEDPKGVVKIIMCKKCYNKEM